MGKKWFLIVVKGSSSDTHLQCFRRVHERDQRQKYREPDVLVGNPVSRTESLYSKEF